MHALFMKCNNVKFSITPRTEGIYDRELNLIGYELLSSVFSFKDSRFIMPDYFFGLLSEKENHLVIKHQLNYIKSKSVVLRGNNNFISVNANEAGIKAILGDSQLLDLIHDISDILRIEINERFDTVKHKEALEYFSLYCKIWLDDLGCGDYIKQKKSNNLFEYVKFDKNSISTILSFKSGKKFLTEMASELHNDGVKILAEGIENKERLNLLLECGFDAFQGWYWG